jgi:hypothetical protein
MLKYFNCPAEVVEVYGPNVAEMKAKGVKVHHADIRTFTPDRAYEVVMWWHGPEHVRKEDIPALLVRMSRYATKFIVFATPNGIYDQGAEYGNPYEVHKSHWTVDDFKELGMQADAIGVPDQKQGNIIAWIQL